MNVYADNAATTKMSNASIKAMNEIMANVYGNPSSLHGVGQMAAESLLDARTRLANCLGANPDEIYFTSGGSEADNQAILSAARFGKLRGKNHLISTEIEHHAVLHTLDRLKKEGFEVTLLKVGKNGIVSPEDVRNAITENTALVSIMYANNEVGTIQPVAEIATICRELNTVFHTDAVQAVGHIPVHIQQLGVDMLSLSGHKFHGPKGVGALYVRKGVPITNVIDGGAQEKGKRAGTENLPAIVGMVVALEEAIRNLDSNMVYIKGLRDELIHGLEKIPRSFLNGSQENRLPGNVNFCFEGIEGESLLLLLDARGIAASSGSACTSGSLDPSHVLLALGLPHEVAHGSLRLSLSEENTLDQINYTVQQVVEVVEYLREISPVWEDILEREVI